MGKRSREKRERRLEAEEQPENFTKRSSKLEKIYFWIIEWGTYLIIFSPLILIKSFYFPYVVPKTIFFRIIVDIIFIAYILLVLLNRKYLPKINLLTIAIIIFVGITILTSFTGVNFERSFWSTFERMTGVITILHLFVFFIVLISCFRERKYWERILTISIIVGVILCIYALTSEDPTTRDGGTIGNVSFMAAYLLFDIFFALILFLVKKGGWRIFYGMALIILLLPLFFSSELPRGAMGGFFPGIYLLALGYMIFSGKRLLKKLAPVALILTVLLVIGISQTGFFKEKVIDLNKDFPGEAREIIWQMSFDGWKDKLWLGWGPENFNIPFTKHFNPKLPITGDLWYDRAHNIVLDTVIASGLIGLLSYLFIYVVAIFSLLKLCPKIIERKNILFPLGMIALLAVYFLQNIWVFDMISTYLMFFLSLAFIYFLTYQPKYQTEEVKELKNKPVYSFLGGLLILIAIFTLYFGNIQSARASNFLVKGIIAPLGVSVSLFQKSIEASPMAIIEESEQFSRKVSDMTFSQEVDKEVLINGFELAAIEMKKSIAKNPLDFRLYLLLGRQYNNFYLFTQDEEKLKQAEIYLEKAFELSPENQQAYWSFAQTRLSQGKEQESIDLMQKSVDLDPRYGQSHWYLAMTYRALGRFELALEKIKDAEEVGYNWKASIEDIKKVISIYQELRDEENLVILYSMAVEREPENAQFRAGLAVAYANVGQFDKARQLAKEALALNPDYAPQIEEFLKSLPQ